MSLTLEGRLSKLSALGQYKSVISEGTTYIDEENIASLVIEAYLELGDVDRAEKVIKESLRKNFSTKGRKELLFFTAKCKYLRNDYQTGLEVIQEALVLNDGGTERLILGRLLTLTSEILWRQGRLPEALQASERAIATLEDEKSALCLAAAFNARGMIFRGLGIVDEALDAHRRALELRRTSGNSQHIANSLNNIAVVHWTNGRLRTAVEYLEQAFLLQDRIENTNVVANWINNTAIIKETQGAYSEALRLYREAEFLFQKENNLPGLATTHGNIGEIKRKLGLLLEAKSYHEGALKMRLRIGNSHYIAESLFFLALVRMDQGLPVRSGDLFKDFPKGPEYPPTVTGFYKMIQALIAQQDNNWLEARHFWQEALNIVTLEFYFKTFCHEQLATISFLQWMSNPSLNLKKKLHDCLSRWESLCRENFLVSSLCKLYLIRAKLEIADFNQEKANFLLKECREMANKNGLSKYLELAEMEIQKLEDIFIHPLAIDLVNRKRLEQDHLAQLLIYLKA